MSRVPDAQSDPSKAPALSYWQYKCPDCGRVTEGPIDCFYTGKAPILFHLESCPQLKRKIAENQK
jgi:hypothetical protein